MRRFIFAFALVGILLSVGGAAPAVTGSVQSEIVTSSPTAVDLHIQPAEAVARKNCSWSCTSGNGGSGQADVSSATRCAATCVAACGGEDNCAWFDYSAPESLVIN